MVRATQIALKNISRTRITLGAKVHQRSANNHVISTDGDSGSKLIVGQRIGRNQLFLEAPLVRATQITFKNIDGTRIRYGRGVKGRSHHNGIATYAHSRAKGIGSTAIRRQHFFNLNPSIRAVLTAGKQIYRAGICVQRIIRRADNRQIAGGCHRVAKFRATCLVARHDFGGQRVNGHHRGI